MNNQTQRSQRTFVWLAATIVVVASSFGCTNEPAMTTGSAVATTAAETECKDKLNVVKMGSNRILTRLFWQDRADGTVYAGDLSLQGDQYSVSKSTINRFPKLPTAENDLVQMQVAGGRLIVGVRDNAGGKDKSGWIEIATGVEEEDHGDHSHWAYPDGAVVSAKTLDAEQGNPAHVYRYGNSVYIANDKNNGFTQIKPSTNGGTSVAKFFRGGGGHITMAAVGDRIAYSTWIDRAGENCGRVDVVDLRSQSSEPRYSFKLPVGGIHGAGACGNRVYFAPANGVCWVNCDFDFTKTSESVSVEHLSLDEDSSGTDYRTGAFESFEDHMLCIANSKTGAPTLCVINATAPQPAVTRIVCDQLEDGLKLSTVSASRVVGNKCFAFAFAEGDGLDEKLLVFDLDPNGDRRFDDAALVNSIEVGASQLEGHFGHHGITFLDDRKTAIVTNPGDGTISVIDLVEQKVRQTVDIGGQPTHVACHGGAM
jgi:YVTN family beta-propeller protein